MNLNTIDNDMLYHFLFIAFTFEKHPLFSDILKHSLCLLKVTEESMHNPPKLIYIGL